MGSFNFYNRCAWSSPISTLPRVIPEQMWIIPKGRTLLSLLNIYCLCVIFSIQNVQSIILDPRLFSGHIVTLVLVQSLPTRLNVGESLRFLTVSTQNSKVNWSASIYQSYSPEFRFTHPKKTGRLFKNPHGLYTFGQEGVKIKLPCYCIFIYVSILPGAKWELNCQATCQNSSHYCSLCLYMNIKTNSCLASIIHVILKKTLAVQELVFHLPWQLCSSLNAPW